MQNCIKFYFFFFSAFRERRYLQKKWQRRQNVSNFPKKFEASKWEESRKNGNSIKGQNKSIKVAFDWYVCVQSERGGEMIKQSDSVVFHDTCLFQHSVLFNQAILTHCGFYLRISMEKRRKSLDLVKCDRMKALLIIYASEKRLRLKLLEQRSDFLSIKTFFIYFFVNRNGASRVLFVSVSTPRWKDIFKLSLLFYTSKTRMKKSFIHK